MGRPLNSNLFGSPLNTDDNDPVLVFNEAIIDGQTINFPYIISQKGTNRYIVSNGEVTGEVVLVGHDPENEGEASMNVITPSGSVVYAIKVYENTVECSDGNTYYWNKFNYVSNTDTVTVYSMVPSQYKSATGVNPSGGKISTISTSLNTSVYQSDPSAKNVSGVGGAGVGATFDITATNKTLFSPDVLSLLTGGTNYRYGEVISIPNVGNIKVTQIMSNLNYITSVVPSQTLASSLTDYAGSYTATGGSGVNAAFNVESVKSEQYETSSILILNAGENYKLGDVISVPNVGTITISGVNSSTKAITQANIPSVDTLFSQDPSTSSVPTSGGTGTGATFSVVSEKVYVPNAVTVVNGGTNYIVGDTVTIANTGTLKITDVDTGTHTITGLTFSQSDTYYSSTDLTGNISIAPTTGTAATIKITSSLESLYYPTSIVLLDGGAGFTVGDKITVGNSGTATVTALAKSGAVKSISYVSTNQYYTSNVAATGVAATGGSGSGATFNISTTSTKLYTGQNASILSGGSGYTVGQVLTLSDFGTVKVSTIDTNGAITAIVVVSRATTLVDASEVASLSPQTTANGTGATFAVTTTSAIYYVISNITVNVPGSGYLVNDSLTISSVATLTVSSVSKAGTISSATFSLSTVTIPLNEAGTISGTGGTGTNSSFTVETTSATSGYVVKSVSVVSGGTGFTIGQVINESFGTITVSSISAGTGAITAFTLTPISGYSENDMTATGISGTGGSGSGATFNVTSTPKYKIDTISINSGGLGYSIGDTITMLGYQLETTTIPSLGTVTVTNVQTSDYHVTSLSLSNNVISPINMQTDSMDITGGSGTGLSIKVNSNLVTAYNVSSITMTNEGTGYTAGDVLTVGNAGTVKVFTVGSIIGKVTSIAFLGTPATYYQDMANSNLNVVGGYGNGMSISVTSKKTNLYYISSISLNSQGNGYEVGDILRVGNSGKISVISID